MKFNIQQKVSARGYYTLYVLDANGNDTGKAVKDVSNVVTNFGKTLTRHNDYTNVSADSIMAGALEFAAGTGTIERTVTDTQLGAELAVDKGSVASGDGTGFTDNLDGTETYKRVCKGSYPLGAINETISEVGIFWGGYLVAGQLIKDGNGNPTTITVLSDEQLVVTYTVEWTYTMGVASETSGTIDVNGTSTAWTLKVSPVRTSGGYWKYPAPSAGSLILYEKKSVLLDDTDSVLLEKYLTTNTQTTNGNTSTYTLSDSWSPSEVVGNIKTIGLNCSFGIVDVLVSNTHAVLDFNPPIPKTDAEVLTVEVSWDLVGT